MKNKRILNSLSLLSALLGIILIISSRNIAVAAPTENNDISITNYATKDELLDKDNFAMSSSKYSSYRVGKGVRQKVKFGYYEENGIKKPRLWNIAGADLDGELALVCDETNPFASMQYINKDGSIKYSYKDSTVRNYLISDTGALKYFSNDEKNLMKAVPVTTLIKGEYETTTDKLYLASGNNEYNDGMIKIGKVDPECDLRSDDESDMMKNGGSLTVYLRDLDGEGLPDIWLRGANLDRSYYNYRWLLKVYDQPIFLKGGSITYAPRIENIYEYKDVVPACELDPTNLLFASTVPASKEATTLDDAMTLRFDGNDKIKSNVCVTNSKINVDYDTSDDDLYLCVQGKSGRNNWVYSKQIQNSVEVTAGAIKSELELSSIDLMKCKIWIEATKNNVTYAKIPSYTLDEISIIAQWKADRTGVETPTTSVEGCEVTNVEYILFSKIVDAVEVGDNCSVRFTVKLADGYSFADDVKCYWNGQEHELRITGGNDSEKKFAFAVMVPITSVDAPKGLSAVKHQSGQPNLKWGTVSGSSEYIIYYAKGKFFCKLDTVETNSYLAKDIPVGKEYTYYVTSVDENGVESPYSEGVTIKCEEPEIPEVIVSNNTAGKPFLSWESLGKNVEYSIYRSEDNITYEKQKIITETSWVDSWVDSGTYYYRVSAHYTDNDIISAYSYAVKGTCLCENNNHFSWEDDWKFDENSHWKECRLCQYKYEIGFHTGGTATCLARAKCSKCGAEYGELAGHIYGTPVFEWKDFSSAKALFTCLLEEKHTDLVDADITCEITKPATVTTEGVKTYTATVIFEGKKYTDTKTESIPKLKDPNSGKNDSPVIASVELSANAYAYNGKAKKPSVIVKDTNGNVVDAKNYTVKYPAGRKNVGVYTVNVILNDDKNVTYNVKFTINPAKTSISLVKAAKKSFTVKWKTKKSQVTGYEIKYSTSKNFKAGNKTVKIKSYKTKSKQIKKLKSKKTYYVSIRTYKTVKGKKYYSDWSKAKKVKVK